MESAQFLSADRLAAKYRDAGITKGGIRWMLFNRRTNGLDSAVIQIGRKILIDETAFVAWLRSHRGDRRAA